MKIINHTDLPYATIGEIIDEVGKQGDGYTHYIGQIQHGTAEVGSAIIEFQIRYLKTYVEWIFVYSKRGNDNENI